MKKMIATLVAITLLWSYQPSTASYVPDKSKPAGFFYYTWYMDEDMTVPTGTVNTVATEMQRLRNAHPCCIFASSPSAGLTSYEYGAFSFYPSAVIYSDLPFMLKRKEDSILAGH
jgi:hypothetical protein